MVVATEWARSIRTPHLTLLKVRRHSFRRLGVRAWGRHASLYPWHEESAVGIVLTVPLGVLPLACGGAVFSAPMTTAAEEVELAAAVAVSSSGANERQQRQWQRKRKRREQRQRRQ
jgi:hypothetical protein